MIWIFNGRLDLPTSYSSVLLLALLISNCYGDGYSSDAKDMTVEKIAALRAREIGELFYLKMKEWLWMEAKYIDMVPIWDRSSNISFSNLDARVNMCYFCLSRVHLFRTKATFSLENHLSYTSGPCRPTPETGIRMKHRPAPWQSQFPWASVNRSAMGTCPRQSQTDAKILLEPTGEKHVLFLLDLGLWVC